MLGFLGATVYGPRGRVIIGAALVAATVLLGSVAPTGDPFSGGLPSSKAVALLVPAPVSAGGAMASGAPTQVEVAPGFSPAPSVAVVGPAPRGLPVTVEVGLAPSHPSALAGLVSALYAPGSPEYRAFLSPSELAQRFGASPSSVSAAQSYFERFGLSVRASPDRLLLTVSGPSAAVGAAFQTTFDEYRSGDGRPFLSHPTAAVLPAIAPWSGVVGLGNVSPLVPAVDRAPSQPIPVTPSAGCSGSVSNLLPCQVWQAYNETSLISGGTNGSGIRLAVVDAYSSLEPQPRLASDLASFATTTGLPVGSVNFVYPDLPPGDLNVSSNTAWNLEVALDLEWARASAPGATIDMTFSPDAGSGLYEAVDWLVAHQVVNVISMSWGEPDVGVYNAFSGPCSFECNASTDGSYGILSPVLAFAAAEGISAFAASGDCGSADGTSGFATNYPSSDPDVTGVGGTVLNVDASGIYLSETAWGGNAPGNVAPGCVNQGGSGGGYAPFPRPTWQTGLPGGTSGRGVPDVALDGATAVYLVLGGQGTGAWGTSYATVAWAGITAIADQYAGSSLGLVNPTVYAVASGANYSRDFHDVTSGNNGYSAGPGWDPVTGLGSPQVANLVVHLAHGVSVASSTLTSFLYASPRFGSAPLTVHFHVNATGGSGTYPLEGVSFGEGNASFAPGGNTTYTYGNPGVYSAQAYVSDSFGNYSASPPLLVVVGGRVVLSVTLNASNDTPARETPVLFSTQVSGGVAPYEYDFSFGDGTFLDGSPLSTANHTYGARGSFCAEVVVSDSAAPKDGGASGRVAIGVGGAPLPNCRNAPFPLAMTANPGSVVRDAPADFPDLASELFTVSGGSTASGTLPPSVQLSSSDPYVAACGCAIFRSPGVYRVTGNASDSENEEANATSNVTVASPLLANFTSSGAFGVAPFNVTFHATATGGYGADAANTVWTNEDGTIEARGATATLTFGAGFAVVVAHLSDLGHGNSSEAFLIDGSLPPGVPASQPPSPYLTATIEPAVDVPLGTAVNFRASMAGANESSLTANVLWNIGPNAGSFQPSFLWTSAEPLGNSTNGTLNVSIIARDLAADRPANLFPVEFTFYLADFVAVEGDGFQPRADALVLNGTGGPESGPAPLAWTGQGNVTGPGTTSITWTYGDGAQGFLSSGQYSFDLGFHTVLLTAADSWGDSATDVFPAAVFRTLGAGGSLSVTSGVAPLNVTFAGSASGGFGPPYEFHWSFGDGGTAGTAHATHSFRSMGTYTVTLMVTDPFEETAQTSWTVTVGTSWSGYVPAIVIAAGVGVGIAIAVVVTRGRRPPSGGTPIP